MQRQGFLTTVVLAAMMVIPVNGTAVGAGPDPGQAVSPGRVPVVTAVAAGAYWTEARMRAAKPMPAARPTRTSPRVVLNPRMGRSPGRVAGSEPTTEGTGINAGDPVGTNYDYPYPFTRRSVESVLQTIFPYRTVGKVFMRQDGVDYVCSGSSVISKPRQVVFTAGHCLNDGAGHWSSHVVFVPARRNFSNPYGWFAARHLWVLQGWVDSADFAYDQAAFDVGPNRAGHTLQGQVGALGIAYDQSRIQHWDLFGYPAANQFSGEKLVVCEASHAVDDAVSATGYDTMGVGCDMTGGSSGGPWILGLGRGNYINGLVSYGYDVEPKAIYGSYFSADTNALRCVAATGGISATTC